MTTPSTAQQKYLRRAFTLNPVWRAEEVIELRSRALKKKRLDTSAADGQDQVERNQLRQAAKQQIQNLQKEFWKLPLDQLKRQLESIDVRQLPELGPVIKRLRTAAACRAEFPRLLQEPWMSRTFLDAFKSAVVLPPSQAGYVRERFLAKITDKTRLQKVKQAAKKIESKYPVLYALERDWFITIQKHKISKHSVDVAPDGGGGSIDFDFSGFGWPLWIVIFIAIRVLLRIMASNG